MASEVQDSSMFFKSIFGPPSGNLSLFSPSSSFRRTSSFTDATPLPDKQHSKGDQKKRKHVHRTADFPIEATHAGKISRASKCDASLHSDESDRKRKLENSDSDLAVKERKVAAPGTLKWKKQNELVQEKRRKGGDNDSPEQDMPVKRRKINNGHISNVYQISETRLEDNDGKFEASIKIGLNSDDRKAGSKRKKEENIEIIYEKRLRNGKSTIPVNEDLNVTEDDKQTSEEPGKKRKRDKVDYQSAKNKADDQIASGKNTGSFDDQEKLSRTIFVGNLPLKVKKKAVTKEFSQYGPIQTVRLRSIPLLDSKVPTRKGAIIQGRINEAINSQHAYIVFQEASHANAALLHNMKEFSGNHLRVDAAHVPHKATNGKSISYDHTRTIFVGNIPFDVKDEELYQIFTPEMNVEAIRVVRDPQTSLSKGIAFVLFKTKETAFRILSSKKKIKLRDRLLRITRVQNVKQPTSVKHVRFDGNDDETKSQRKRAKLSASYEGIRAKKEAKLKRHGSTSGKTQKSKEAFVKDGSKGTVGSKRKREEKKQRGTSRSKKIRRT